MTSSRNDASPFPYLEMVREWIKANPQCLGEEQALTMLVENAVRRDRASSRPDAKPRPQCGHVEGSFRCVAPPDHQGAGHDMRFVHDPIDAGRFDASTDPAVMWATNAEHFRKEANALYAALEREYESDDGERICCAGCLDANEGGRPTQRVARWSDVVHVDGCALFRRGLSPESVGERQLWKRFARACPECGLDLTEHIAFFADKEARK